jgi:hypothetical protein
MSWMPPSYPKEELYQLGGKRIYMKNLKYDSSLNNIDIINNKVKEDTSKTSSNFFKKSQIDFPFHDKKAY